ncbi:putative type VI secretion system protein [Escherichia coli]|uniref:Putative type VI secretion system protein n=1 Tax=Escherichia coli TaxID=562 RepID=A0A3S4K445_ECOLX|nr:putative type VI secretion system protein [Escherichia coli]
MAESRTERQSPGTDYHETGGQILPLLGKAISENECLTCDFVFYRTNRFGINEPYYKLKLTNARISNIGLTVPHTINDSPGQPEESVSFTYESITGSTSSPEPVRTVCGVNGFSKLPGSLSSALLLYFKKAI